MEAFIRLITERADDRLAADLARPAGGPAAGHREQMSMIMTAVCCWLNPRSRWHRDDRVAAAASDWAETYAGLQDADGLFTSSGNISSPPDSGFSLNDACQVVALLRDRAALPQLDAALSAIIDRAASVLTAGGVHTPNHRWEISSVLARIDALRPDPRLRDRIAAWLDEGIDIDADGIYSERSANYAAYVSNPSLLVLADLLHRPELAGLVHRNLHAITALTGPDGRVETVFSRRQDQRMLDHRSDHDGFPVGAFALQYHRFAAECPSCARMWQRCVDLELAGASAIDPTHALAGLLADRALDAAGSTPAGAASDREPTAAAHRSEHRDGQDSADQDRVDQDRVDQDDVVFDGSGVAVLHRAGSMITINAGSDVPAAGRVGSGLACNPTFLRWQAGEVVLNSVRLSREFFGLGPFRSATLERLSPNAFRLREQVAAAYYQPMTADHRDADGRYALQFDGRFSASMAFADRDTTEIGLDTTVTVTVEDDAIVLDAAFEGAGTTCCFEFGFRPGGLFVDAEPIGEDRWLLGAGGATYRCGDAAMRVTADSPAGPAAEAGYQPGEAYTFLGGTDAVGGPRLYLPVTVPGRMGVRISLV